MVQDQHHSRLGLGAEAASSQSSTHVANEQEACSAERPDIVERTQLDRHRGR